MPGVIPKLDGTWHFLIDGGLSMRKGIFLLLSGVLFLFLLAACDKEKVEEAADDTALKTEEAKQPLLTLQETKELIDDLVEKINTVYIDAGEKYNLDNPSSLTDEIYASMSNDLQPLATDTLIETDLFTIAKDFCYGGCDASYFPTSTQYGLRFKMLEASSEKVTLQYTVPEDEISGHRTEQVTIKNEEGTWKLDSFSFSNTPMNLTKEEAEEVLKIKGYSAFEFVEETELHHPDEPVEKIYIFRIIGESTEKIGIMADTGYNYMITDDIPLVSQSNQKAVLSSKKAEYLQMLKNLESELAYIDDLYADKSVAEMRDLEEQRYQRWDRALNDIYGVLKEQLSASEMDALRQKQREWIDYRDTNAEKGTEQMGGGWQGLQYTLNLTHYTKERCYELINDYMK